MPVALLERIPVPSLWTYTFVSCSLFASACLYAHQLLTDEGGGTILPFLRGYFLLPLGLATIEFQEESPAESVDESALNSSVIHKPLQGEGYATDLFNVLLTETWCVWVSLVSSSQSLFVVYQTCPDAFWI